MKYNAITILVDSVIWECVGTIRTKVSPTPFLDSLKAESLTATKLYSHAPFTDGATRSLYTGRNTLDDYSFFLKLNSSPINHFQLFHEQGYETYGMYYAYYMYGSKIRANIDHTYYTGDMIFMSEWHTFSFFAGILKKRELKEYEMKLLIIRMELMFDVWMQLYKDVINDPSTIILIKVPFERFNSKEALKKLEELYVRYKKNKPAFIIDFLKNEGKEFRAITQDNFDELMDRCFFDREIYRKNNYFFKKATRLNFKANICKSAPSIKRVIYGIKRYLKTKNIDELKFLANYYSLLRPIKAMKKQSHLYEWKTESSSQMQMGLAAEILRNRRSDKPFYMSLHVLDPHNYLSCFTFDKQDPNLVEEEIHVLNKYLDDLGSDFRGNILYYLSLRYTDYCIEKFCEKLKEMNLWDTTALMVVADHGSSYSFSPLHGARVNTFDDECYHIPLTIRIPGTQAIEINHFCNSKDVLPTFMDALGLPLHSEFKGHSLLDKTHNWPDYVQTEYTGPGCPEVRGRRLWFSCRDDKYMVAYRVAVYENFEDGELVEVHDLIKDKDCYYNLNNSIDISKIKYLLDIIEKRFEEVKVDSLQFLESL